MFQATLKKMQTENLQPINYFLDVEAGFIKLNDLLEKKIMFVHVDDIDDNCTEVCS